MENKIRNTLYSIRNIKFRDFTKKLIPETNYEILGVQIPKLKMIAKELSKDEKNAISYIKSEHLYYEEYMISALTIGYLKTDFNTVIDLIEHFLPYVNTWGICDSFSANLKIFKNFKKDVYNLVKIWLNSNKTYTVRFGIVVLLNYFVKDDNISETFELLKNVKSDNYYINMALAWFYSVALVYHYDLTVKLLKEKRLTKFVQNKCISKAIDSFRINLEQKIYLKSLKI